MAAIATHHVADRASVHSTMTSRARQQRSWQRSSEPRGCKACRPSVDSASSCSGPGKPASAVQGCSAVRCRPKGCQRRRQRRGFGSSTRRCARESDASMNASDVWDLVQVTGKFCTVAQSLHTRPCFALTLRDLAASKGWMPCVSCLQPSTRL